LDWERTGIFGHDFFSARSKRDVWPRVSRDFRFRLDL
jgi:hypothetical protein